MISFKESFDSDLCWRASCYWKECSQGVRVLIVSGVVFFTRLSLPLLCAWKFLWQLTGFIPLLLLLLCMCLCVCVWRWMSFFACMRQRQQAECIKIELIKILGLWKAKRCPGHRLTMHLLSSPPGCAFFGVILDIWLSFVVRFAFDAIFLCYFWFSFLLFLFISFIIFFISFYVSFLIFCSFSSVFVIVIIFWLLYYGTMFSFFTFCSPFCIFFFFLSFFACFFLPFNNFLTWKAELYGLFSWLSSHSSLCSYFLYPCSFLLKNFFLFLLLSVYHLILPFILSTDSYLFLSSDCSWLYLFNNYMLFSLLFWALSFPLQWLLILVPLFPSYHLSSFRW